MRSVPKRSDSLERFHKELEVDGFFTSEDSAPVVPIRPQTAWVLFNPEVEDAYEVTVAEETEREFWVRAKVPVPFDVPTECARKWIVRIPSTRILSKANAECVICREQIRSEDAVQGCCDDHVAHPKCYATIHVYAPHLRCVGTLWSPCADAPAETLSGTEKLELDRKVLDRLKSKTNSADGSPHHNEDAQRRKRLRVEKHDLAIQSIEGWEMGESESVQTTAMCIRQPNDAKGSACVVCGESTKNEAVYVTCQRHKTHAKCYVYYRALRERYEWRHHLVLECPSTLFHTSDCKKSLHLHDV